MKNKRYFTQVMKIFKKNIDNQGKKIESNILFYNCITESLKETIRYFQKLNLDATFYLSQYLYYNPSKYPLKYTERNTKTLVKLYKDALDDANTLYDIAFAISSRLDEMLYYELQDFSCPRCESGVLVMMGKNSGKLALVCEVCTWKKYLDEGKGFESVEKFVPAKTTELRDGGFIE